MQVNLSARLRAREQELGRPVRIGLAGAGQMGMIVKACAGLLAANRELNVSFGGDKLVVHQRVHVGVAVAVDGGLLVPVVRDADQKSLTQVAREAGELVGRARAGRLGGDDMTAPCRSTTGILPRVQGYLPMQHSLGSARQPLTRSPSTHTPRTSWGVASANAFASASEGPSAYRRPIASGVPGGGSSHTASKRLPTARSPT